MTTTKTTETTVKGLLEKYTPKLGIYKISLKSIFSREDISIRRKFLYLMMYLYSLATFGCDSRAAFKFVGELEEILGPIANVFKRLSLLVNKWGYRQDRACVLISKKIKNRLLKEFLLRLAYNLSIGASFQGFIRVEYDKFRLDIEYLFSRAVDKLRIICDAYTAIINASIVIAIAALITSILFGIVGSHAMLLISVILLLVSSIAANLLIKLNLPEDEEIPHMLKHRPKVLKYLDKLVRPTIYEMFAVSILPAIVVNILDIKSFIINTFNYSLLVSAFYIIPGIGSFIIGKLGLREVNKISELDSIYPVFIRTLGEAASISGSIREGLRRILYNDFGVLTPYIRRLYMRLKMGVESSVAWRIFMEESGSTMIYYLTMIFIDSVSRGAVIRETANMLFDNANMILRRRAGRDRLANYLRGMVIPLQVTFTAVVTMITVLISLFTLYASKVAGYYTYIAVPNATVSLTFLFVSIAIMSIGNSIAIYLMKGDTKYTLLYNHGLLLLLSGLTFLSTAAGSSAILKAFMNFGKVVRNVP